MIKTTECVWLFMYRPMASREPHPHQRKFYFLCSQSAQEGTSELLLLQKWEHSFVCVCVCVCVRVCGFFYIDKLNMRLMSFFFYAVLLFRAPSWSGLSGKMIELSARPHVPSVIASWNILEFAHFNHTERTTETKKRSYIKTVKLKTRDTEFIILHIFSACPSLPWFFFIPVQHLLSLSLSPLIVSHFHSGSLSPSRNTVSVQLA